MTGLLELRDKIKLIYSKNEVLILPVVKFLLAFLVFNTINGKLGYMTALDNIAIVLIVSLLCSFMPNGCMLFLAAVFSLLHMYAMSMEVALVGLCIYLLMYLVYLRFGPKDSIVIVLTVMLCLLNVPYIMPVVMGLVGTPVAAVSIGCGIVVYYLLTTVVNCASTIGTMGEADATAKIRLVVDGLLDNKAMLVMITAFAITVIVVYLIRRMSVDYSWTIAMVAGAMLNLVILLIGDLLYDTNMSVLWAILGSILAILVAKVVEFFRFCVDYSRTEKVQFEDDEYYYYVKAVPKLSVATPTKTVKKINTQKNQNVSTKTVPRTVNTMNNAARSTNGTGRPAGASRTVGTAGSAGNSAAGTRPVSTVRTVNTINSAANRTASQGSGRGSSLNDK